MLKKLLKLLLDHIFPYFCVGCNRVEGVLLCRRCYRRIKKLSVQVCPVCKKCQTDLGAPCAKCTGKTPLDYLIVATDDATGVARRLVYFFKYRFIRECDAPLSGLLLHSFLKHILTNEDLAIVPVPLHPDREKLRGFNQSYLLARQFGSIANIAVWMHILRRTRKTKSQMELSREARLRNIQNAFRCVGRIPLGTEILLIDDIATTRATLETCAAALKQTGVRRVGALVVSRGT